MRLYRIWKEMSQGSNIFDIREVEGSTLTYDVYQEKFRGENKPPLVISDKVIESIGDDREVKLGLHGGQGMYAADMRDFHRLLLIFHETAPDLQKLVNERSNALLIRGRETSVGEQVRFLTGVREVWKMFLRQQQNPISVLLSGYRDF